MKRLFAVSENQMKKWLAIVGFCVFLIPCAYGETIPYGDGGEYVGEVSNGMPHGQGTFIFPDGAKHVGEWENGLRHGQGAYTDAGGRVVEGKWENGELK